MALTRTMADALIARYGPTISTVSSQVSRQYAATSGRKGHGYEVISADDIEQATYEQLIKSGVGADELDAMESPQGYIRTTARLYGAANEAKARRRAMVSDFQEAYIEQGLGEDGDLGRYLLNHNPSTFGNPEAEVIESDLISGAQRLVETILTRVTSLTSREVARHFYLGGLDSVGIAKALKVEGAAVRKALQRAREEIGPEADASLRAWRAFAHPDAKRPQGTTARPTALIALVGSHQ